MDYDPIQSLDSREVNFLPPHFFVINFGGSELKFPLFIDKKYPKLNVKTFSTMNTSLRLAQTASFIRNFIEERLAGRYYISPNLLFLALENEEDVIMFNLLVSKH